MISKLKLERYKANVDGFHNKYFVSDDITEQLALPVTDCERRDELLDTTSIVLYSKEKEPIKPFTRMKLPITDATEDGDEEFFRYRYVENDKVENICMGNDPIYKHSVNLIEITKILERVSVDNITFTNYLDENYGFDKEVPYSRNVKGGGIFGYFWVEDINYTVGNNIRFRGPYQYLGTTINTNVRMDVVCGTELQTVGVVFTKTSYKVPLYSYWVEAPDGTTTNLMSASSFTYTQKGKYKFYQRYYIYSPEGGFFGYVVKDANILISWEVQVIDAQTHVPQRYTVTEVIDRLLKVCELKRQGIDNQRFFLDESIRDRLDKIHSPEFAFTQGTLFEALSTIGSYIHAIPRLIPEMIEKNIADETGQIVRTEVDDYNNWNMITFDFLGDTAEEFTNDDYSLYDAEQIADDYSRSFVANIENGTQTNYSSNIAITEPFLKGAISPRTESVNYEISNDNAVIKLSKGIGLIIEVTVINNGIERDITNRVIEESKYNLLASYCSKDNSNYNNKAYYLHYKRGSNIIDGLTYKMEESIFTDAFTNEIAIKNIIAINDTPVSSIKDLSFRIKYIPFLNLKVKQFKQIVDIEQEDNELYYNQQANSVDIESFGEQVKGSLLRTGNRAIAKTQVFSDFKDTPKAGQISMDNYYVFAVNKEIFVGAPVKTTTEWSKDYNKMNEYVGLKKHIRQYEISESESVRRNIDYQEFCLISNSLDYDQSLDESEQNKINAIVSSVGFGAENSLKQITSKLKNESIEYKPISYAIVKTSINNDDGTVSENQFLLPVSCSAVGNSVVVHFTTTDNYSAGSYSEVISDNYNIERFVKYANDFGRFETMEVCLGSDNPIADGFANATNIKTNSQMLYQFDKTVNDSDILVDYRGNPFIVHKDSREEISFTGQLNFVSDNSNIIIGKGLAHTMPVVGDKSTGYKYVLFNTRPNKFALTIDSNMYTSQSMPTISYDNNKKTITISETKALTNCVGYGILDAENRLVLYCDIPFNTGDTLKPIYLMFRRKV